MKNKTDRWLVSLEGTLNKRRGIKNSTIWYYIVDLRALFFWAMKNPERKKPFVRVNPVSGANLDLIQNRKVMKPPLKLKDFERAFSVLNSSERTWWRTHECLGLRMDEGNRLERTDIDLESGMIHVPGPRAKRASVICRCRRRCKTS